MKILYTLLVASALVSSAQAATCPHFPDPAKQAFEQGNLQNWSAQASGVFDKNNIQDWDGPTSRPCPPNIPGDQCCIYYDNESRWGALYTN